MSERSGRSGRGRRARSAAIALGVLTVVLASCSGSEATPASTAATTSQAPSTGAPTSTGPATSVAESPTSSSAPPTSAPSSTGSVETIPPTTSPPASDAQRVTLPGSVLILSLSWPSADVGWVLADRGDGARVLLHTTDSGASWAEASSPDVSGASQVLFADTSDGWVVGESGVQSTHDGGATWVAVSVPGGITTGAAVATAVGTVHLAYIGAAGSGIGIASSPIDHDAFVPASITIPFGAGPRLDVSMSAGGPYAELVYDDRTLTGAAEIREGTWANWDLTCPFDNPAAVAGLSPQGHALAIACSPSGFGDNAPVDGANLSSGTLAWTTIEPAGDPTAGQAMAAIATATDEGVRIVVYTKGDGTAEIASSTDGGATWPVRTPLPAGATPVAITHLPDASLLLTTSPSGGLASPDGLTWTPVATSQP